MISMAAMVRRHIAAADPSEILTTRAMQYCGTRGAVDQELARLVSIGTLIRLSYGVFVRHDHPSPLLPPDDIVKAKAAAFGKRIVRDGKETLALLNVIETPRDKIFYSASGCTTEFNLIRHGMRVQLKAVSERKMHLGDSAPGTLLRALWQHGEKKCSSGLVHSAMQLLNRTEKESIWKLIFLMPAWLKHEVVPLLPQVPFAQKQDYSHSAREKQKSMFEAGPRAETVVPSQPTANQNKNDKAKSEEATRSKTANNQAFGAKPSKIRTFSELLYQLNSPYGFTPFGYGPSSVCEVISSTIYTRQNVPLVATTSDTSGASPSRIPHPNLHLARKHTQRTNMNSLHALSSTATA